MRHFIVALLTILLAVAPAISRAQDTTKPRQHAVLVTGASSGIGLKITERLAKKAYFSTPARAGRPTSTHWMPLTTSRASGWT